MSYKKADLVEINLFLRRATDVLVIVSTCHTRHTVFGKVGLETKHFYPRDR